VWAAVKHRDRAALERLLTDDFVARTPGEPDRDRADYLGWLLERPGTVRSLGSPYLAVQVLGETAVVMGVQSAQVETEAGTPRLDEVGISNVFQWDGAGWALKLARTTRMGQR
jgi:hypothetical protein